MIQLPELEQGTPEWHEWRNKHFQASEAAIIMSVAPAYWESRTWDALRAAKAGMGTEPSDFAKSLFAKGHEAEEACRAELEKHFVCEFTPLCGETKTEKYGASFDGFNEAPFHRIAWIEIKHPTRADSKLFAEIAMCGSDAVRKHVIRDQFPHIYWQLVHQARVASDNWGEKKIDKSFALLVIYRAPGVKLFVEFPVGELLEDWPKLDLQWQRFGRGELQGRADDEWREAAGVWLQSAKELETAKKQEANARKILLDLVPEGEKLQEGAGVRVVSFKRDGRVDWEKMSRGALEQLGMTDAEVAKEVLANRKPGGTSWRVSEIKE